MINHKIKLLISNTDYGSAEQHYYFLKNNNFIDKKNSIILFNETTKLISKKTNIKNKFLLNKKKTISSNIVNLVKIKKINFFIVGLNSVSKSIDLDALKLSKKLKIKSGCIQDFWGNCGYFTKQYSPDLFWVLDKYSKKKIRLKINNKTSILVTGSPKYELKKNIVKKKNYKNICKTIVLISQPLETNCMKSFYNDCISVLKKINTNIKIYFLQHPGDKCSKDFIEKKLNFKKLKIIKRSFFEKFLYNKSFISISCFSTMTYDLIFKNAFSQRGCFHIFYQNSTFRNNFKKEIIGSHLMPLSRQKITYTLRNKHQLSKLLNNKKIFFSFSSIQSKNSKKYFDKMCNSSIKINKSILAKI